MERPILRQPLKIGFQIIEGWKIEPISVEFCLTKLKRYRLSFQFASKSFCRMGSCIAQYLLRDFGSQGDGLFWFATKTKQNVLDSR